MTSGKTGAKGGKNDKYVKIIDAAIKVFAKNGFFHSKVAEIAKEAGVADGTIYLYFKNKDDILIQLFENKMEEIIANIREDFTRIQNPLARLRRLVHIHFEIVRENADLAAVITVELRQSTKFMKEYKNEKFQEYLQIIAKIIKDGKDMGMIRPGINPAVIKRGFFGMLDELMLYCVLSERTKSEEISKLADSVSDVLIRGIANNPDEAVTLSRAEILTNNGKEVA